MSTSVLLAMAIGAAVGTFAGRLALDIWLAARRRDRRRLAAAQRAARPGQGCSWHREGGYGFVWTCRGCRELGEPDPVAHDEGEGLFL